MTLYSCHCGEWHDTASAAPCPKIVGTLTGLYELSPVERFLIVCSLRKRHPEPSRGLRSLIARLDRTPAEVALDLAFLREKLDALRGGKT